jgi:uncharacterized protein (TIGR00369 family)
MQGGPPEATSPRPLVEPGRSGVGGRPVPIHDHAGLEVLSFARGGCEQELEVPAWLREPDQRPSLGAIAILADSTIGWTLASSLPADRSMVTAQLRFELARGSRPADVAYRCRGSTSYSDPDVGYGRGELIDDDGQPVAWATMRSAPVALRAGEQAGVPLDAVIAPDRPVPAASIDEALDACGAVVDGTRGSVKLRCQPHLANSSGGVHGGVIALMGERALRLAVSELAAPSDMRPLELDVLYVRRLPADESIVEARAEVIHQTRRFLLVRGEVLDPQGRPAALLREALARPV